MSNYIAKVDFSHTLHILRSSGGRGRVSDRLTYCGRELVGPILKTSFVRKDEKVCVPCQMSKH